ncbi:MAG: hypothetical protein JW892_03635, partial [Anaerolineae bacterium]|nr:hypothetical protein [Anaerolineae bacterium]
QPRANALLPLQMVREARSVVSVSDLLRNPGQSNFRAKVSRLSTKSLSLIDFLRWGAASPQKINSLLRPVGMPEIFAPVGRFCKQPKRVCYIC